MSVADQAALNPLRTGAASPTCPQVVASVAGARPRANPGHFGGIAILPLFLDEPEVSVRRQRATLSARRSG